MWTNTVTYYFFVVPKVLLKAFDAIFNVFM